MKISIFGVGYVGLVTGACFAELGNDVMCCDINEGRIKNLKQGEIPIHEPGLEEIVLENIRQERLLFTTKGKEAIEFGDIIFIAVGTPSKGYGQVDLSFVYQVAKEIGRFLDKNGKVIVTKSTVPVGTNQKVKLIIMRELQKRNACIKFATVSNPEFLKEGDAINDFMKPDRVVIGSNQSWAKRLMEKLYLPLTKNGHPIFYMDIPSAELSKYAANAFLATKISFINQIATLSEIIGADIEQVRAAICADKRIGKLFLYPGVGYGGSCFSKDVQGLAALAKKHGYTAHLIESIETVNENQKKLLAEKVIEELGDIDGKKLAVWGLAFKPKTDDMRCAPSVTIIEKLIAKGANIHAYDPVAMDEAKRVFNNRITYCKNMYEGLKDAEALLVITEWPQFKEPDFIRMKELLKNPMIFDGRNIYSAEQIKDYGFEYIGIGRPKIKKAM